MEWFSLWWQGLDIFTQALYCVALPSTLILLIQVIMILFGFGHDGAGVNPSDTSGIDVDMGDGSFDSSGGIDGSDFDVSDGSDIDAISDGADGGNPSDMGTLHFFSVQGIITFLAVFSWSGIIIYTSWGNMALSLILGFILGAGAMFLVAKILQLSKKLAQNGTLNMKNLIGAGGTVYLVIPEAGKGHGKVSVTVGERIVEFDAITEGDKPLPNGTGIRVTDIRTGNMLVVEQISEA